MSTQELELSRLEPWLRANVPGYDGPLSAETFPGGQSNPTFKLTAGEHEYVLRRKPPGELLASAHAVDREYRVSMHCETPMCSSQRGALQMTTSSALCFMSWSISVGFSGTAVPEWTMPSGLQFTMK